MPTSSITDAPSKSGFWAGAPRPRRGGRAGIVRLLAAAWRGYRLRRDARRLMAFSDHMLKDLGLGRSEIAPLVRSGRSRANVPGRS